MAPSNVLYWFNAPAAINENYISDVIKLIRSFKILNFEFSLNRKHKFVIKLDTFGA